MDQRGNCKMDSYHSQTNTDSNRYHWKLFVILCHAKNFSEESFKLFLHVAFGLSRYK